MVLDVVQLLGVALIVAGVWAAAPTGVALILTGLIVVTLAIVVETRA